VVGRSRSRRGWWLFGSTRNPILARRPPLGLIRACSIRVLEVSRSGELVLVSICL
jgi:hypothetical protein